MLNDSKSTQIRVDFIEKIGLISQAEGLPRIAGRIFGTLVFDGEVVSFTDLAERLQVSRASISTCVRQLEERGLIKRLSKPGERQDYFQLAQNPYENLVAGAQKRARAAKSEIKDTLNALPKGSGAAERLKAYAGFYGAIEAGLGIAVDEITLADDAYAGHTAPAQKDETHDH